MTVFICTDEVGGMLFNERRQSRDKRVIEDIIRVCADGVIYISDFSEVLFADSDASVISVPNPIEAASEDGYAFVENISLSGYVEKIDRLIIYNWNERYPSDVGLDIEPRDEGFRLKSMREFKGKSHEKITRRDFVK